jgi:uncharacterized protein with beta-barrel porin domain
MVMLHPTHFQRVVSELFDLTAKTGRSTEIRTQKDWLKARYDSQFHHTPKTW